MAFAKHTATIAPQELVARIDRGDAPRVLDVRTGAEFAHGHVPGAVNVPFHEVPRRLDDVPGEPGDELIVYCGHGPRAYLAGFALRRRGKRRVIYLRGHWAGWRRAALREEK